ncbi:autotransporter outer membrane beta-barrel domain-containing protein [Starkeya koreensis]|uniref:Autotransporter outer membrane beta-barrel domain-containing protein n=1 Tax=Ancylobacter koreensis TaxID=266121 RepID=A0ABT0DRH2_9HYPH|nr:autotransporter outer membrane beta-barrel domain-containing protein [Ancylobacter koreensis]MCK0209875.1 autotransporter outer membrane beta-barrel domain-containing protein [Ancylobacter koreensis]
MSPAVEHRKGALFSSVSTLALSTVFVALAVTVAPQPASATSCTGNGTSTIVCDTTAGYVSTDIVGTDDPDSIKVLGGTYGFDGTTWDAIELLGKAGGDTIFIGADGVSANTGNVEYGGSVSGGDGNDKITIGSADSTADYWVGIHEDVSGDKGDDEILINALHGDVTMGGEVKGGSGEDKIIATASGDSNYVLFEKDISGGSGDDFIKLKADDDGLITFDDIEGNGSYGGHHLDDDDVIILSAEKGGEIKGDDIRAGEDNDFVGLFAEKGGKITVDDISGGDGSDKIYLTAEKGGEIRFDDISGDGGYGYGSRWSRENDKIVLTADKGGKISGENIDGNDGEDFIGLFASDGGDIYVRDIDGGDDDDVIILSAEDGRSDIRAHDIDGGDGEDFIGLFAEKGAEIKLDDIDGGEDDDTIKLSAEKGGEIRLDDIKGGDGDDEIKLSADTGGEIKVDDITGGKGDDKIFLTADDGGEIRFDDIAGDGDSGYGYGRSWHRSEDDVIVLTAKDGGKISGENIDGNDGEDFIGLFASDGGDIYVRDIDGGDDDDVIVLSAEDGRSDIRAHDIDGGDGEDFIGLFAEKGAEIKIDDIDGGEDDDTIKLSAEKGGEITLDDIKGGDGDDEIKLSADTGGEIKVDDITGGKGDDKIFLTADDGGEIRFDDIAGDGDSGYGYGRSWHRSEDDVIVLTAKDGGKISGENIDGNDGEDFIGLFASDGGDIYVRDIDGGDDDDVIVLSAEDGRSDIRAHDIDGGDGEDFIGLFAEKGAEIKIDDIDGGEDDDTIKLSAEKGGEITVDDIKGGKGDDKIFLSAEKGGEIRFNDIEGDGEYGRYRDNDDKIILSATDGGTIVGDNIDGNDGTDFIGLFVSDGGDIYVHDIDGGDGDDVIVLSAEDRRSDIRADDIDGGDDEDFIGLFAEKGAEIKVDDIDGGDDDDTIKLSAEKGGEITVDDIKGGKGDDKVFLIADKGGEIRFDNIEGDGEYGHYHDNDDKIVLFAQRGGEISGKDIDGNSGGDFIGVIADGGQIRLDDIDGGDGDDTIVVAGTDDEDSWIRLDNIRGGDGDDYVKLSGLDNMNSNFSIWGGLDGGRGFDTLVVTNGSTLSLDDVEHFQQLGVSKNSYLELTQRYVNFNGTEGTDGLVVVDPTSYLRLTDSKADLDTGTFVLEGSADEAGYREIYTGPDAGFLKVTGGVLDVAGNSVDGTSNTRVELYHHDGDETLGDLPAATFINQGTIALHNGQFVSGIPQDVAGDRFTINGDYIGGGNLLIDTFLYDAASATDILVINGNVSSEAVTTIYVNNTNPGEGINTGTTVGSGIKVVDITEGHLSPDETFQLAQNPVSGRREVMAGAFAYRLYQDPTTGGMSDASSGGDWFLRAGYTSQATSYATAPSAVQNHFYAGMDTLYKRLGEMRQQEQFEGRNADLDPVTGKAPAFQPLPAPKFQMWGRGGGSDLTYDVSGGWDFSQQTWGMQAGGDYTFDYSGWRVTAGAFGGYGWSDVDVAGDWTSWDSGSSMDINGWSAGIYTSIRQVGLAPGAGFYTDLVGKVDVLDIDITSTSNVTANTSANVWGASAEVGYGFEMPNAWVIQPQVQLAYVVAKQDDYYDSIGTYVSPGDAQSLIGRLGLQVQSTYVMATGQTITPYATFNVLSEFMGDNKTNVAGTVLTSDINGTWYNAGLGFTADLNSTVALFGNAEYNFGDVEGWVGQGGIKFRW